MAWHTLFKVRLTSIFGPKIDISNGKSVANQRSFRMLKRPPKGWTRVVRAAKQSVEQNVSAQPEKALRAICSLWRSKSPQEHSQRLLQRPCSLGSRSRNWIYHWLLFFFFFVDNSWVGVQNYLHHPGRQAPAQRALRQYVLENRRAISSQGLIQQHVHGLFTSYCIYIHFTWSYRV